MEEQESFQPNKEHAAVCGLFCKSCPTFIGTFDDPEGLAKLAEQIGIPVDDTGLFRCSVPNPPA
jgi:hypothetical protein